MLSMREYFNQFKTIVVLGASSDPYRTSYHIAIYLQQNGYRIVPVNPNEEEVLGEKSYRSEEHTSELQSRGQLVCRLLLEKKNWQTRRSTLQPAQPPCQR